MLVTPCGLPQFMFFAFNPVMLLVDTNPLRVVQIMITFLAGLFGVAAALRGKLFRKMNPLIRLLLAVRPAAIYVSIYILPHTARNCKGLFAKIIKRARKGTRSRTVPRPFPIWRGFYASAFLAPKYSNPHAVTITASPTRSVRVSGNIMHSPPAASSSRIMAFVNCVFENNGNAGFMESEWETEGSYALQARRRCFLYPERNSPRTP